MVTTDNLRAELIQVAAVAIAAVQDIDTGAARAGMGDMGKVLAEVMEERKRQNQKFGAQHHPVEVWLSILGEEVGEACKAANDDVLFVGSETDVDRSVFAGWRELLDAVGGNPDTGRTPTCEHGWNMEHCTKDSEGSCPWNGSKVATGHGPWQDQECYCPGPHGRVGPNGVLP